MTSMRTILPHLDDVGVTAGSMRAWAALRAAGVVRSASVMVPCPYYRYAVEDFLDAPDQDLGIHVTLNSEWSRYRWRPLTGPAGGLVDEEGFFHRRPEAVLANADPQAVEDEISAQVERAISDGIRPTHIDAHMGTAFLPSFMERLWAVASRHGLAVPLYRNLAPLFAMVRTAQPDTGYHRELVAEADNRGDPVFDSFLIGFTPEGATARAFYADMIAGAAEGLHWLAMHANAPDDTIAFAPHMVRPRQEEFSLFSDPLSASVFGDSTLVNWFDLGAKGRGRQCA